MSKSERYNGITPVGYVRWAHLNEPVDCYEKDKGQQFEVDIAWDPQDEAWGEFESTLNEAVDAAGGRNRNVKKDTEKDAAGTYVPTGRSKVKFTAKSEYQPTLVDASGNRIPNSVKIGNGSRVRVKFVAIPYSKGAGGVKLCINSMQIIEFVDYMEDQEEFAPVSGGYTYTGPTEETSAPEEPFGGPEDTEVPPF